MAKYIYHSEKTKTTCNECSKHDGKIYYDIKDIPQLPIHPNCKCWIETVEDKTDKIECDCKDRMEVLKTNLSNILENTANMQKSIKSELLECAIYLETNSDSKEFQTLQENLISTQDEISALVNSAKSLSTDIDTLKESSFDPTYHTKSQCKMTNSLNKYADSTSTLCKKLNDLSEEFKKLKEERKSLSKTTKVPPKENSFDSNTPFKLHAEYNETSDNNAENKKSAQLDNAYFSDETLKNARRFIQGGEGYRSDAYQDIGGIWTIGYGHTGYVDGKPITKDMKISKEKAEELYRKDFESHSAVLKEVKVPLTENQKIALASFIYNCGIGAFKTSMLQKLNEGDMKGAADKFDEYINVTNPKTGMLEVSQGLINRRKKEKELFLTPDE